MSRLFNVHLLFLLMAAHPVKLAQNWKTGLAMVVRVATVAFEGIEARPVDVQVQIANGNVVFTVVGLGDKAGAESRERVRAALNASGLAMPAKRIAVNLPLRLTRD
jgi:Subunit ChlI of Mg-chelatase